MMGRTEVPLYIYTCNANFVLMVGRFHNLQLHNPDIFPLFINFVMYVHSSKWCTHLHDLLHFALLCALRTIRI